MTVKTIIKQVIGGEEWIAGGFWLGVEMPECIVPCGLVLSNFHVPQSPRVRVRKRLFVFRGQAPRALLPKLRRCGQAKIQVIGAINTGGKQGSVNDGEPDRQRIVIDYKQCLAPDSAAPMKERS